MGTVIQDNILPIEKLEMSTLLIASTIHGAASHGFDSRFCASPEVDKFLSCASWWPTIKLINEIEYAIVILKMSALSVLLGIMRRNILYSDIA
jgi:hypothetical protein